MGKMIGAAEFKAHCLRILDEVERTGEPITITKRGRPVAEVKPLKPRPKKLFFGCMANPEYRFDDEALDRPAYEKPWNAELGILGDQDEERTAE
jgi:prevent-host-death family protein